MREQMDNLLNELVELFPTWTIFLSVEFNSYYYDFCKDRGGVVNFKASIHGPTIQQFEAGDLNVLLDMILDHYTK